jgi:GNAT superfamily N-acetyltransferase
MSTTISRLVDVPRSHAIHVGLDAIFYESSARTDFPSREARTAFRELWLGQYLTHDEHETFVALDDAGTVAGYIVGSLADPAGQARYATLGYFAHFAHLTCAYPAHLHINVAAQYRSDGIGARLLAAFVDHIRARSAPGVHVVTGQGMRNVGFYLANGFLQLDTAPWNGRTVVMLGRKLR